ncbi:MAG TPA: hypothetical protein VK563_17735 [Puia sp.]|nr:hypothetical protein [Puia sp.]
MTPHQVIRKFSVNRVTGLYDIDESRVSYSMPLELTRLLKAYYTHFRATPDTPGPTLANWYAGLPLQERSLVKRSGTVPEVRKDWFADAEPDEQI